MELWPLIFVFSVILAEAMLIALCYYDIVASNIKPTLPYLKYNFIQKEINMGLVYELTCAAPVDADVMERRLTVTVNGVVLGTDVFSSDVTNLGERSFVHGDSVVLSLVDVDDVGNMSEPAVVTFVASDTIAPSSPALNIQLLREE